jgi:hypothetical protein
MRPLHRAAILVALIASCGKAKPPPDATATLQEKEQAREDAIAADMAASVDQNLPNIRAALAARKLGDAALTCQVNDHVARFSNFVRFKRIAAEYQQLCGYDVPIARMKHAVEHVEAARGSGQRLAGELLDCTDLEIGGEFVAGREAIKDAKRVGSEFLGLVQRWKIVCPRPIEELPERAVGDLVKRSGSAEP